MPYQISNELLDEELMEVPAITDPANVFVPFNVDIILNSALHTIIPLRCDYDGSREGTIWPDKVVVSKAALIEVLNTPTELKPLKLWSESLLKAVDTLNEEVTVTVVESCPVCFTPADGHNPMKPLVIYASTGRTLSSMMTCEECGTSWIPIQISDYDYISID